MKKLTLRPEDLRVDTFSTDARQTRKGTVVGHYGTTHTDGQETCWESCFGTCGGDTCDYTCRGYATSPDPRYACIEC